MALFLSTFTNKVDRKGRCSVPSAFRAILSNLGHQSFFASPSLDQPAIDCQGPDAVGRLWAQVNTLPQFAKERRSMIYATLSNGIEIPIDPDGRIILPERFRERAGIDESVSFVGIGDAFQLWNPSRFEEVQQEAFVIAAEVSQTLGAPVSTGGGSGT